jgi:peptidoglycan hydrolase CwlO-like protein
MVWGLHNNVLGSDIAAAQVVSGCFLRNRGGCVRLFERWRWTSIVLALASASVMFACATSALSAPAATSPTIEAKKAQEAAARAEIESRRVELDAKVAEYMALGRQLERTRTEISDANIQLAAGEVKLVRARSALTSRAVEIYRAPQMGLLDVLIGTHSLQDLFARARYLAIISDRDARMMRDYRLTQSENLYLQQSLADKEANLVNLQNQADEQRKQIERTMAAQQARAAALGADVARLVAEASAPPPVVGGAAPSDRFQRETVISQTNFRASTSMDAPTIQAFLETQPGALKSYVGLDHAGVKKTAAEMIADASVKFNVNPKVILATLQKEQSLLSTKDPSAKQYAGAMGAGMPDSKKNDLSMQGFGNQIWWGAQKQDKNARDWHPGASEPVDGTNVFPTNEGTFAQYRYTPHFSGVMSFWMIYWRYFGDPLSPAP